MTRESAQYVLRQDTEEAGCGGQGAKKATVKVPWRPRLVRVERHNRHSHDAVEAFLAVALNRNRDMRD